MKLTEKRLRGETLYSGKIVTLERDIVLLENNAEALREVVRHPGGACVAAVDRQGNILLVRQYRYPYAEIVTEVPAGKLDPGEDPFAAARRELLEETGCEGECWVDMGTYYPSPGFCDELLYMYMCIISGEGDAVPDEDEFVQTVRLPIGKAVEMIMNGEIVDGKTQTVILKAMRYIETHDYL